MKPPYCIALLGGNHSQHLATIWAIISPPNPSARSFNHLGSADIVGYQMPPPAFLAPNQAQCCRGGANNDARANAGHTTANRYDATQNVKPPTVKSIKTGPRLAPIGQWYRGAGG